MYRSIPRKIPKHAKVYRGIPTERGKKVKGEERTLLQTILVVVVGSLGSLFVLATCTRIESGLLERDSATYSWPGEKTGVSREIPMRDRD